MHHPVGQSARGIGGAHRQVRPVRGVCRKDAPPTELRRGFPRFSQLRLRGMLCYGRKMIPTTCISNPGQSPTTCISDSEDLGADLCRNVRIVRSGPNGYEEGGTVRCEGDIARGVTPLRHPTRG